MQLVLLPSFKVHLTPLRSTIRPAVLEPVTVQYQLRLCRWFGYTGW